MYKKSMTKRLHILESATKVFAEKGYSAVTMKDISDSCQIGRSSLYHYFSSVEEIYNEVVVKEKRNIQVGTDITENFLSALKIELLSIDKSLHRAVTEHLLANGANNCF